MLSNTKEDEEDKEDKEDKGEDKEDEEEIKQFKEPEEVFANVEDKDLKDIERNYLSGSDFIQTNV